MTHLASDRIKTLKELAQRALDSKSDAAKRGHWEAAVAFVTYDGAAADLNALAQYVSRLEFAIAALSALDDREPA